jgi:rapamycin-insensitive companion of mTOR
MTDEIYRVRNKHPRYFSSITLFHRALHTISNNHYLAPVRRFILDLFDVSLEPDILVQLHHLDLSMYRPKPTTIVVEPEVEQAHDAREALGLLDIRRRSASSPGPEPPGRVTRMRGLTISEMEGGKGAQGAREKIRGFGSLTPRA